jgi:hypothetical protein
MVFLFPLEPPCDRPEVLWALQGELLRHAEFHLGARDANMRMYQPQFGPPPPILIHSQSGDGAWARLSPIAAQSWSVATYEMAHETVHLLNPVVGSTIFFEEGIAVDFSFQMSLKFFGGSEVALQDAGMSLNYRQAWDLVRGLGGNVLTNGRTMRMRCGALGKVTVDALREAFPDRNDTHLLRLCEKFG